MYLIQYIKKKKEKHFSIIFGNGQSFVNPHKFLNLRLMNRTSFVLQDRKNVVPFIVERFKQRQRSRWTRVVLKVQPTLFESQSDFTIVRRVNSVGTKVKIKRTNSVKTFQELSFTISSAIDVTTINVTSLTMSMSMSF